MKHETDFTDELRMQTHSAEEIWPVHAVLHKKNFYQKII